MYKFDGIGKLTNQSISIFKAPQGPPAL